MTDKKDWKKFREEHADDIENNFDEEELDLPADEPKLDHPSYSVLEDKLTEAEQKAHDNWEKATRALAELDNVRRRSERDVENAHRYGQEKLIVSLLPVIDSLEQALQISDKEGQSSMAEGLQLTLKLFLDALGKHNVMQIDPQDEIFNPQEHEAMSIQTVPGAAPNSILTVFQKGYKLNERVIRPARVIVAKA